MGKYFTIAELTYSAAAARKKIDNTPNEEELAHLNELIEVLDRIREAWGSAIIVSSGFRCERLNKILGGAKNSAHKYGYAVDIEPKNGKNKEFLKFLEKWLLDNNQPWDQLISEYPVDGVPAWIHFGLKNKDGKQRRQVFTIKK